MIYLLFLPRIIDLHVFDIKLLQKSGFTMVSESNKSSDKMPPGDAVQFKRDKDGSTLYLSWTLFHDKAQAKSAWDKSLENYQGPHPLKFPLPPSGKPLGDTWQVTSTDAWQMTSIKDKILVFGVLHYPSKTQSKSEHEKDGILLEKLLRQALNFRAKS